MTSMAKESIPGSLTRVGATCFFLANTYAKSASKLGSHAHISIFNTPIFKLGGRFFLVS